MQIICIICIKKSYLELYLLTKDYDSLQIFGVR